MCAVHAPSPCCCRWALSISHVLGGKVHTIKMATDFLNSLLLRLFTPGRHVPRITRGYSNHFGVRLWPPKGVCMWSNSIYSCGISLCLFLGTQNRSFACLFVTPPLHKFNSMAFVIVRIAGAFISPRWAVGNAWNPESFVKTHPAWGNAAEWIRGSGWCWTK